VQRLLAPVLAAGLVVGCGAALNDPYPAHEQGANVLYTAFTERPKHLDPVQSYSEDEATFLYQIVEPPLQYHYLKRPYVLEASTADGMPRLRRLDASGRELPPTADPARVASTVVEVRIRPGILYQPHPAFAITDTGAPRYLGLTAADLRDVRGLGDFAETGTRELVAADYVYQIKRLAHPRLHSPIFELMAEYLPGLKALHAALLAAARTDAETETDTDPPGWLDLDRFPLPGVEVVDRYTYRITLQGAYPQFLYWLSMPFFSPVPREADRFFAQPGMVERNLTLDWWPVGTGPYMLVENNPNARMVLARNPNYRGDAYPCEGEGGDAEAGLLADCGKTMPFIDKVVFSREREGIPYWNKFLQGYYDASGVSSDNFDQAVTLTSQGEVSLSEDMEAKGIRLLTSVSPSIFYLGFNMLDPLVGGGPSKAEQTRARKLRQAISIALDMEEFVSIFLNGRGLPGMSPLPPGIFGAREGRAGVNPVVYEWQGSDSEGRAVRRNQDEARRLLAEAGWPNGRNAQTGEPLVINLDTTPGGLGDKARSDWLAKQFRELGVQFVVRPTDFNRFQDKVRQGNAQLFFFGWNADYPDPENLLFLLHGAQGKVKFNGQNAANYANPEYDALFERMKAMPDGPARQQIIDRMVAMLQQDAPWIFAFHPMSYSLQHGWVLNRKTGAMVRNTMKYQRLDIERRAAARTAWNRPVLWPLALVALLLAALVAPALIHWRRRETATAAAGAGSGGAR
jgi:ABC-type transport system substrate-binding protein